MINQIKVKASPIVQLSIIIEERGLNVAELDVQLIDANLVVTTMHVRGKPKAKLCGALFKSLANYACEHYLHIVSFNPDIDKKLQEHPQIYYNVGD